MSSSPVSESTSASRIRQVAIAHKKSVLDLAASRAIADFAVDHGSKRNRRSTRSQTVLDRSIHADKVNSHLPRCTTIKKAQSSSKSKPKPLWKTVLSVFMKNFLLILVLALLVQMLRGLAFDQREGNGPVVLYSDYEKRFAEMDAFLKTSMKLMQLKIDSVDERIHKDTGLLRTEVSKRIDDDGAKFSVQLQELNEIVESMEKSLTTGSQWLSKDEFQRFMEEFRGLKLDDIRAFSKGIVEKEIDKHVADGLGRVDYAVASGGATVADHSEPFPGKSWWFNLNRVSGDAVKMLQPSFGEPGQCFPLKGNNGFVEIKLRTRIIPQAITLEHVAKSVAFDRSSAPRECRVFGWLSKKGAPELLTEFVYDLEKTSAQTFDVVDMRVVTDRIRLDIMSNHGNPQHTCIYRLRVHGQEPHSLSSLALHS